MKKWPVLRGWAILTLPGIQEFQIFFQSWVTSARRNIQPLPNDRICLVMSGNKMGRFTQKQGEFRK